MECVKCSKIIEDRDLYCGYCGVNQSKFIKYINKVEDKIHKDRDKNYNNNVKNAQWKLKKLEQDKQAEIVRITNNRWQSTGNNFSYNMTEGKIMINGQVYIFSDINGAEINAITGFRTITNTTGKNNQKSKKHISLGGAVAGALINPIGAVIGGSVLGKTTTTGDYNHITTSNDIPICHHIGVLINLNGFNTEIILLSNTVDQKSSIYNCTINNAQDIVDTLRRFSTTPISKKWLNPEEEQSVLDFDPQIEEAAKELQKVINSKPNYDIPKSYYK
ncbi:MAG: hypothetical protein RSF67_07365 [Clostridia bacterium]